MPFQISLVPIIPAISRRKLSRECRLLVQLQLHPVSLEVLCVCHHRLPARSTALSGQRGSVEAAAGHHTVSAELLSLNVPQHPSVRSAILWQSETQLFLHRVNEVWHIATWRADDSKAIASAITPCCQIGAIRSAAVLMCGNLGRPSFHFGCRKQLASSKLPAAV